MNSTILGILMLVLLLLQCVVLYRLRDRRIAALKENYNVIFGDRCNNHGVHGYVMVDSRIRGTQNQVIPFTFEGVSTVPEMSLSLMKLITEQAAEDGYTVRYLQAYRGVKSISETIQTRKLLNNQ